MTMACVFPSQKLLTIQGKSVAMQYSNPRHKFEDWLCNSVSENEFRIAYVSHHTLGRHTNRTTEKKVDA